MKTDLEALMVENGYDAIWVSGPTSHNPPMTYLLGVGQMNRADLFIQPGRKPILAHGVMEREEAAKSGYDLIAYDVPRQRELAKIHSDDPVLANALYHKEILEKAGITSGKVLVTGIREFGVFHSVLNRLEEIMPGIHFEGDAKDAVIAQGRATKSPEEAELIRQTAKATVQVVQNTWDFLAASKVQGDTLIKADGSPLTIGDVKQQIEIWMNENEIEAPNGFIFAIGKDAGVPHNSGTPSDPIQLGKTIVFDIYPCKKGGGYFYDFTRTWCVGYAPAEVQKAYDQVEEVHQAVLASLELGKNFGHAQILTCKLFEEMGHPTVRQDKSAVEGYVHGLGHGVGLAVHENPNTGNVDNPSNELQPGHVITVEPGLYYPESKGWGIRIEDTYLAKEDGSFECFAPFPHQLVIPIKEQA